jgi:hypothetical protein
MTLLDLQGMESSGDASIIIMSTESGYCSAASYSWCIGV